MRLSKIASQDEPGKQAAKLYCMRWRAVDVTLVRALGLFSLEPSFNEQITWTRGLLHDDPICLLLSLSPMFSFPSRPLQGVKQARRGRMGFLASGRAPSDETCRALVDVAKPHALSYAAHGGTSRGYSGNLKAEQCLPRRSVGRATPWVLRGPRLSASLPSLKEP